MFSKSFVSIYFLPDRVLILRLSANKKKIVKHGQVILPAGLIKDYRIQDIHSLSKVLSSSWSKLHIKEKIVGVVIPEFSTFTKYFKIPNLPISEVDEAVRWQAQEYLPGAQESMILDWKITKKSASGIEVLVVAVDKEILSEYIEVIEKAGLFPMKVETPSICLLRYLKKEGGGVLLIYKNFGEIILVLSEGEKIVGTSIQHTDSFDEALRAGSKMLNHYSDTTVEKVVLAGEDIEKNSEKTATVLKRKVIKIDPGLDNVSYEEVQKSLIPLSLQYEDAEQPADPTTLNLLPASLVDKYKFERLKIQTWSLTLTITLFVWISFFVTLASYLFMTQSINDLKAKNSEKENSITSTMNPLEQIESINKISQNVLNIKKITVLPQVLLNGIYLSKPSGLVIQNYDLDLDKGVIRIQGYAVNRITLIQFKENLEKLNDVEGVDIPISSFEEETNLEFNLTFLYKPISSTITEKTQRVSPKR